MKIPNAQSMFDEASRIAEISATQKVPSIIKLIKNAVKRQETSICLWNLSDLSINILIPLFRSYGYSIESSGVSNKVLEIGWNTSNEGITKP